MGVVPAYALLAGLQAALVVVPARRRRLASSRAFGILLPAAAMIAGVTIAQVAGGAAFLAALAAVATPVLAAGSGWARGWRLPLLPAFAAAALFALAWLRPGSLAAQAAGVALIAGACIALTGLAAALAPPGWLTAGLVVLVALDVVLVWGDRQVAPTMQALSSAAPPVAAGHQLPSLQQVVLGPVTMGWLDLAAPALLGLIVARPLRAGAVTGLVAGAWGLLLLVTSPIAATPPVLAGLLAGAGRGADAHRRLRGVRAQAAVLGRRPRLTRLTP